MRKITFPLKPGMSGPLTADLQNLLQQCLERRAVRPNDENAGREWYERLRPERAAQKYSHVTRTLLSIFQRERNLQSSGEVDEPTADARKSPISPTILVGTHVHWRQLDGSAQRQNQLSFSAVRPSRLFPTHSFAVDCRLAKAFAAPAARGTDELVSCI